VTIKSVDQVLVSAAEDRHERLHASRKGACQIGLRSCAMLLDLILFSPAFHKTLWLNPAMAAGVVERTIGKEDCVSVIGFRH
jgi:hypothetical protein